MKLVSHRRKLNKLDIPYPRVYVFVENSGLLPICRIAYEVPDNGLITTFVERWHRDTNSFHLPVITLMIILDNVSSIMHIPSLLTRYSLSDLNITIINLREKTIFWTHSSKWSLVKKIPKYNIHTNFRDTITFYPITTFSITNFIYLICWKMKTTSMFVNHNNTLMWFFHLWYFIYFFKNFIPKLSFHPRLNKSFKRNKQANQNKHTKFLINVITVSIIGNYNFF